MNPGPTLPGNFPKWSQTEDEENRLKRTTSKRPKYSSVIQRKVAVVSGFATLPTHMSMQD